MIPFFSNQDVEKQAFRTNLTLDSACLSVVAIGSSLAAGLLSRQVLLSSAMLLPTLLLGTVCGIYLS